MTALSEKLRLKRLINSTRYKTSFISGVFFFFLIHLFRLTNSMPNHDALSNFYSSQNTIGSGRWFLSIACLPSSYFNLTWFIGVLCAFYIGLTCIFVVSIFNLHKKSSIIITGGLIASFPGICETLLFDFTADGYLLAMLFAAVAVKLTTANNSRWYMYILAGLLLCLSCGTYQAYLSFAALLSLLYLIMKVAQGEHHTKELVSWALKQLALFAAAVVAYYVIWQFCLKLQSTAATEYLGISGAGGFGIATIIAAFRSIALTTARFYLGESFLSGKVTFYFAFNMLFILLLLGILSVVICKRKLHKKPSQLFLFIASLVIIPFAAFIWQFTSRGVSYGPRMMESLALIYILPLALAEKHLNISWQRTASAILCAIIFLFSLQSNIAYFYLNKCYEATYHTASDMAHRIHMTCDTGEEKVAIIGRTVYDAEISNQALSVEAETLRGTLKSTLAYDQHHISRFISEILGDNFEYAADDELLLLEQSPEIAEMDSWPSKNSVRLVDGFVVIKLAEPSEQ